MVLYCIAPGNQRPKLQHYDCKSRATFFAVSFKKSREGNGALERIRTSDLCLRRAALYPIMPAPDGLNAGFSILLKLRNNNEFVHKFDACVTVV